MTQQLTASEIASLQVNGDRLNNTIKTMGRVGALPNGGVRRLAFSPEDIQARKILQTWMESAGMTTTIDTAGNLIGRYPGRFPNAPALATGSHLDTVPNAGIYDGTYGVLAGLEVVRTLHDRQIHLDHALELIIFADEERTMIGSKAMAGQAPLDPDYYAHPHYEPLPPSVAAIGGDWDRLTEAQRQPGSLAAFVELHVEQGPVLEAAGGPIGLVTGIVGQRRYSITIEGQASHAGTTPMDMRQDALVAAAQVILAVNRIGTVDHGDQVATVGSMKLSPNVVNTIPGQVEMTLDIRDLSNDRLDYMVTTLEQDIAAIAQTTQTRIHLQPKLRNEPVPVNSHIHSTIAQVCEDLGLPSATLPSRASHDAQIMASLTDMAMIFVPSDDGISHAETEYTSPEHCTQGANVLLHTLLRLDHHYGCTETVSLAVAAI
ncbi:MAG: Zn-dependent hydrolase [Cyanobacteria bacterium]|nr:Zn-dependent hydrolase [Cyanobacteriota bacterium]MDA0865568.1 Zn-dependent hydrolase [Cyanobacteriota bacterium]